MKLAEMSREQLDRERAGHATSLIELETIKQTTGAVHVGSAYRINKLSYTDEAKDILIERLIAYSTEALAEIDRLLGAAK